MKTHKLILTGIGASLVVTSCILTGCSFTSLHQNEILTSDQAIIGGTEVKDGDEIQKSVVAVYDSDEGALCTGTLLANNIVVTAAHCIGKNQDAMIVLFGNSLTETTPQYKIDRIEVSSYWASQQFKDKDQGDIAVLHFKGVVPPGYHPATFITTEKRKLLKKGTAFIVAGYGIADINTGDGAGILRQTTLTIEDMNFGSSEILVDQSQGSSVCHGDSGGPAFLPLDGKYYFWGLTSRGIKDPDNTCNKFSAFTSASFYRIWIQRMAIKLSISLTVFGGQ